MASYATEVRPGQVHVWTMDTQGFQHALPLLNPVELARAQRIRREVPQREFVVGRAALRVLLSAALGRNPANVELTTGEHGKLATPGDIDFNVAHSHGVVAVALSRAGAVGIDVEFVNPAVEADDVAQQNFHPDESAWIAAALTPAEHLHRFFVCWTRKEAVLKADGRGLTAGLSQFCATDRSSVRFGDATYWLHELTVGEDFCGAMATLDPAAVVVQHRDSLLVAM